VTINERLNDAIDGYLDVAKKCTQMLIDIIFKDLRPATKQLSKGPWYDGTIVPIVETMQDYMADYQTYLTCAREHTKPRMPAATTQRIRDDVGEAGGVQVFRHVQARQGARLVSRSRGDVLVLLEASKSLAFL
jgi:exocyst complex component 3